MHLVTTYAKRAQKDGEHQSNEGASVRTANSVDIIAVMRVESVRKEAVVKTDGNSSGDG